MLEPSDTQREATRIVNEAALATRDHLDRMFGAAYPQLCDIADGLMAREGHGQTIQATALVHEAYVRLIDRSAVTAKGTAFFKACFSRECRRILVDRARARNADRRGGPARKQTLLDAFLDNDRPAVDVLELNDVVESLTKLNERMGRLVDMRIFGGMTIEECALALDVSARTLNTDWKFALAWLKKELA